MESNEIELLIRVIPLAIGAAFTPSLFGLQLVAAVSKRWVAKTTATATGSALAFAIAISLLLFGFANLPANKPGQDSPIGGVIWLVIGIILGASATWLFMPHPVLAKKSEIRLTSGLNKAHPITFFGVAFALSIKDVTSFALLIPALHDIAASDVSIWFKVPTAVLVYVIALIGVVLPPIWRLIRGEHAEILLNKLFRFTMDHQFKILAVVAVFFAVYCIIIAIGAGKFGWVSW